MKKNVFLPLLAIIVLAAAGCKKEEVIVDPNTNTNPNTTVIPPFTDCAFTEFTFHNLPYYDLSNVVLQIKNQQNSILFSSNTQTDFIITNLPRSLSTPFSGIFISTNQLSDTLYFNFTGYHLGTRTHQIKIVPKDYLPKRKSLAETARDTTTGIQIQNGYHIKTSMRFTKP